QLQCILLSHVTMLYQNATYLQYVHALPILPIMTEITQTRTEIAVAHTLQFLDSERGTGIDGNFAAQCITEQVRPVQELAEAFLTASPIPKQDGFYAPLGKHNAYQYGQAVNLLPGYMVLVPSAMVERAGSPAFYPAVASPDGQKENLIRLHVLRQPYHVQRGLGHGAATVLSAAGQSEVASVGQHGRLQGGDGIEAEHFATLLAAGSDPQVQVA